MGGIVRMVLHIFLWYGFASQCFCEKRPRIKRKYPSVKRSSITDDPIHCYDCSYTQNYDRVLGTPHCLDKFDTDQEFIQREGVKVVNCSGQCEKSYVMVSEENYVWTRRCSNHCHDNRHEAPWDQFTLCCETDYCNNAPVTSSWCGLLAFGILILILYNVHLQWPTHIGT